MRKREVRGVQVPVIIYGTAWKEERTAALVSMALEAGFRAIDTANQRKHYHEAGVGEALADGRSATAGEPVFLQTKFTHPAGQDHRMPYDPSAPIAEQVLQSFESSLEHLGVESVDSFLIHGPSRRDGWSEEDREVWRTMEQLAADDRVRLLGVSNVTAAQVDELASFSEIEPAFVQNRCYAALGWDLEVRRVCLDHGIAYQGFSLLTANAPLLNSPLLAEISGRYGITPAQLIFAFSSGIGMFPLTGTTSSRHMAEDLAAIDVEVDRKDLETIERIALRG